MRVKSYFEENPDSEVIVIANKRMTADMYWDRIQKHLGIKKRAWIITDYEHSIDGIPIVNSLVLKVGRWWENKNAREIMLQSRLAKMTLPITFIPPVKGGDDDT